MYALFYTFVLLFSLSVAFKLAVYGSYFQYTNSFKPVLLLFGNMYEMIYSSGDYINMRIVLKNIPSHVRADINITQETGTKATQEIIWRHIGTNIFGIYEYLKEDIIYIDVYLTTLTSFCATIRIVKGEKNQRYEYQDIDRCVYPHHCVIEVDVGNVCQGSTDQISQNDVLIYVILSVIGTCILILVIFVFIKKYYHRNSQPVETVKLNIYTTANEVVYADLNLVQGDGRPPRNDEESLYAEIIQVSNSS